MFVGIVEKTDPKLASERGMIMAGEQTAWVRVTEPFKGVKEDQVLELNGQFSSCFGGYRDNTALLFYLHPGEKEATWVASACGRTRSVTRAADDLKFLRGLPASARGNRVSGTIELWEGDSDSSRVFAGVRVRAVGSSDSYETFTDADGLYEFRDLPPGTYSIKIDYPKGTVLRFPIAYGRTGLQGRASSHGGDSTQLDVTDTSGNGFSFILSPDTRITGRVLGPDGRPMKGVCLYIEPLGSSAETRSRGFDCTEADGSYVLDEMAAGSYRIVANRDGEMSAAAPFGRLYYPGTPDMEQAGVVTIASGQHLDGIDFRIPELARRIELRGRLIFSNGVPLPDEMLDFRGNDGRYQQYGRTEEDGSFVVQILAGRPGTLTGKISIWRGQGGDCPQFNAKFHPQAQGASLQSMPYPVGGDNDLIGIEVVFPFPSCDAWLKEEAATREKIRTEHEARTPSAAPKR